MAQVHYATIPELLKAKGVKSYRQTFAGLVAVHKRNSVGDYYWDYYRYYTKAEYPAGGGDGYYFTGSTSKWEA